MKMLKGKYKYEKMIMFYGCILMVIFNYLHDHVSTMFAHAVAIVWIVVTMTLLIAVPRVLKDRKLRKN